MTEVVKWGACGGFPRGELSYLMGYGRYVVLTHVPKDFTVRYVSKIEDLVPGPDVLVMDPDGLEFTNSKWMQVLQILREKFKETQTALVFLLDESGPDRVRYLCARGYQCDSGGNVVVRKDTRGLTRGYEFQL
jgi:hypothetical protein